MGPSTLNLDIDNDIDKLTVYELRSNYYGVLMGSNLSSSQFIDVVDVVDVECGRTLRVLPH